MAFTKTTWVDNTAPALTAAQLNRIETGILDVHPPASPVTGSYPTTNASGVVSWSLPVHILSGGSAGYGATVGASSSYTIITDFGAATFNGTLPVIVEFACRLQRDANTNADRATFACFENGVQVTTSGALELTRKVTNQNDEGDLFSGFWYWTPTAGSRTITVRGKGNHTAGFFYTGWVRARCFEMRAS